MIVTLDGRRLNSSFAPDTTLQGLVDQVRAACHHRLIISVAVNGQRLTDDDLSTALERPLAPDAQVDLDSGDALELVGDALRGLALEFEAAARRTGELAHRLVSGEAAAAVRDAGGLIGLWQTCQRVMVQCSGLLQMDLTQCTHEGRTVQEWFEEVAGRLREVRTALEARDLVLLADLLRYELTGLCEAWQGLLDGVAGQVGRA